MQARRSIALGSMLVSLIACDPGDASDASELPGIGPAALTWVLERATIDAGELVSDLGYRVHIEAGWIGSWGATLVECGDADQSRSMAVAPPVLVAEGHSTGEDDRTSWVFAGVESLVDEAIFESESLELGGVRYCQAHYLLAPISDASQGYAEAEAALALLDRDLSLAGASVVIVGSWEPPGGGPATPFVLRSEQGYGRIIELELGPELEPDGAAIEVVVRRELAGIFDQIDFASAEPDEASWQLLGNIAKQSRAIVRVSP